MFSDSQSKTLIHRLNPAVKLIVFLSVIQMAGVTETLTAFSVLTACAAAVQIYAQVSPVDVFYRLKPFVIILLVTFIMNFFFATGLNNSAVLTYRFFLIIYLSILLSETTDTRALASILALPVRGRAGKNLKVVMLVAMEFIPIFIEDAKRTVKSLTLSPQYEGRSYKLLFRPNEYIKPLIHSLLNHTDSVARRVEQGEFSSAPVAMPNTYEMLAAFGAVTAAVLYAL